MSKSDVSQMYRSDGRYNNEMENLDMMLNYENGEFLRSDFFDTIKSVENGIQEDLLASSTDGFLTCSETDGFLTSSETSSHIDCISPRNDVSESDSSTSPSRIMEVDESLLDFLTPIEDTFSQVTPQIVMKPKAPKIIIQHPKKIINKQIVASPMNKIGKKQILKVQSLTTTNGKPVILPCGLKNIKILNVSDLKAERIVLPANLCRRKPEMVKPKVVPKKELTEVKLTPEEKRLLDREGIQLPTYHPLTKLEDRELKRIRRKIRNKISAQDSRKRKKEYVDGLEERVKRGSEENKNLMQRVKELQKKNRTLMTHIQKLQSIIFNSTSTKATPSTCLMIVMLSILLVSLPNIRLTNFDKDLTTSVNEDEGFSISRSLLSTKKSKDDFNMDELFTFNVKDEIDFNEIVNENHTDKELMKLLEEMEGKYEENNNDNFFNSFVKNVKNLLSTNKLQGFQNKKGFIEPDIDEFEDDSFLGSPLKKIKLNDDFYSQNDENFVPLTNKIVSLQTGLAESKNK